MSNKRLKILFQSEINEFYSIPQFNSNEQAAYFDLGKKEYQTMSERGSFYTNEFNAYHLLKNEMFKMKTVYIPEPKKYPKPKPSILESTQSILASLLGAFFIT